MGILLSLGMLMFPESKKAPVAAPVDGAPAELTNELVINAKEAVKQLWASRRYDKMKPAQRHAALGYKLDKEEALGYLVCRALHKPLLSPAEARTIGKRAGVLPALEQIATHRKRGTLGSPVCTALLGELAPLSLAPPPRSAVAAAQMPPPPPQPPPPPKPSPSKPKPASSPIRQTQPEPLARCLIDLAQWEVQDVQVLRASREVDEATTRAWELERFFLDEADPDYNESEEEKEVALVRYRHSLARLKAAFPSLCPGWDGKVQPAGEQNSTQCVATCGGRLGTWPWTVQTGALGFCGGVQA